MTINIQFGEKTVRVAVEINGAIESAIAELPQREWVGLTDKEINGIWEMAQIFNPPKHFYLLIEAKLKEKNT